MLSCFCDIKKPLKNINMSKFSFKILVGAIVLLKRHNSATQSEIFRLILIS